MIRRYRYDLLAIAADVLVLAITFVYETWTLLFAYLVGLAVARICRTIGNWASRPRRDRGANPDPVGSAWAEFRSGADTRGMTLEELRARAAEAATRPSSRLLQPSDRGRVRRG
jgi:hypothetical protein